MTERTATPHGERPQIEQTTDITGTPIQQICHWIVAHKLEACRVCTGFRIDELGLTEVRSALRSRR